MSFGRKEGTINENKLSRFEEYCEMKPPEYNESHSNGF